MNVAEALRRLQDAMPPGEAWTRHPDAELTKLLRGIATTIAAAATDIEIAGNEDMSPMTAINTIEAWEQFLFDATYPELTDNQRRALLTAHLSDDGGSAPSDLISIMVKMGYSDAAVSTFVAHDVTHDVTKPLYSAEWRSVLRIDATSQGADLDKAVASIVKKRAQSHVQILFYFA